MRKLLLQLFGLLILSASFASCDGCIKDENGGIADTTDTATDDGNKRKRYLTGSPADTCYPSDCLNPDTMCSDSCIKYIAECHQIDSLEFAARILNKGHYRRPVTIGRQLDTANCGDHYVSVHGKFEGMSAQSDTDIVFSVIREKQMRDTVYYTVAMFKGILALQPDSIFFHKARRRECDTCNDIVMRVTIPNKPARYYDISDTTPPSSGNSSH